MRKGEKLISHLYELLEEKEKLNEKIFPSNLNSTDKTYVKALATIKVIMELDDDQFDRMVGDGSK